MKATVTRRTIAIDSHPSFTSLDILASPTPIKTKSPSAIGISGSISSSSSSSKNNHNHHSSNNSNSHHQRQQEKEDSKNLRPSNSNMIKRTWAMMTGYMNSTRLVVLLVLCLQNSMFTILRRYSQGVLKENYSKHELLLVAEVIKLAYSAWMIKKTLSAQIPQGGGSGDDAVSGGAAAAKTKTLSQQLAYLAGTSKKMMVLALIYGAMNILSFVSLRNISAGMFTIFAQTKILTTATFSTIMLKRQYSWTRWRALIALMMGVLLFSEPIWGDSQNDGKDAATAAAAATLKDGNPLVGTVAVLVEVSLSGFASIYFEKVIKMDPLQLGIWERNFQLALGSIPVYVMLIIGNGGGPAGFLGGWSPMAWLLSFLGAAGGLLVALSIKHGDSILKTLATTGAIVLTGLLDHAFLGGPLTPSMVIAGVQVILAICNYTFDATNLPASSNTTTNSSTASSNNDASGGGHQKIPTTPGAAKSKQAKQQLQQQIHLPAMGSDDSSGDNINVIETESLLRRV